MADVRERLLKQFRELVGERLERISHQLITLERGPDVEAGRNALRDLHGLKGEARMMGFSDINKIVHEMEELVRSGDAKGFSLSASAADALLAASDAVSALANSTATPDVAKLVSWLKTCVTQNQGGAHEPTPHPIVPPEKRPDPPAPAPVVPTASAPQKATPSPPPPVPPPRLPQAPPELAPTYDSGPKPHPLHDPRAVPPELASQTAIGIPIPPELAPTYDSGPKPHPLHDKTERSSPDDSSPKLRAYTEDSGPKPNPLHREAEPRARSSLDGSVRIRREGLERLTTVAGNLQQAARRREVHAQRQLQLVRELREIARGAEALGPWGAALAQRLGRAKDLAAELHRERKLLSNEELRDLDLLVEEVQALRMVPLQVLFEPYQRMVRDLSRELGKEVDLKLDGEDARADRTVVEALREPLLHLVRNAIDHGIESRVDRVASGKSPKGTLVLRAHRDGQRLVIEVEDDGAGLDVNAIRDAAVRKGLMDEEAARSLSDQVARDLIFLAGFSSREATTDISGRGIGLDVVRVRLHELGGDVQVRSTPGKGATFELRVPVSRTVAPLLFAQVGEERLGLMASQVVNAVQVSQDQIRELAGRPALKVGDDLVPFATLGALVGVGKVRPPQEGERVLVLGARGLLAAVAVDRVLDESVQPVLPLRGMLANFPHLNGATQMADGALVLVLSPPWIIAAAHGQGASYLPQARSAQQDRKRRRLLVADDSPLTRELLASLLESVGYEVITAQDGQEALERLGRDAFDLVVTDLEMPRMDGLELTRRMKQDAGLRATPVVIVTTRGSESDRRRGMEAGADAYIAKGDLVRQDLVDVVKRLLGE